MSLALAADDDRLCRLQRRITWSLAMVVGAATIWLGLPWLLLELQGLFGELLDSVPSLRLILGALRYASALAVIAALIRLDSAAAALPQRSVHPAAGRVARWLATAPGGTIAFAGFYVPVLFKSWAQGITYNVIGLTLACIGVACAMTLARQTCEFDALIRQGAQIQRPRRHPWFRRTWMRPWLVLAAWLAATTCAVCLLFVIRFQPMPVPRRAPITGMHWVVWTAMAALPLAVLLWIATVVSATRSLARWRRG